MLFIKMKGHSFKHDLQELIKAILPKYDIRFLEDTSAVNDNYLLSTSLIESDREIKISVDFYRGKELIKNNCETIDKDKTFIYDLKREIKQSIKRNIYDLFLDLYDRKLPWGILTGIRPVKIVHDLYEKNIDDSKIYDILKKEYRIDPSKAALIIEISQLQRKHIYPLDGNKYSLYVGIPYCPSKCSYCSFPSFKIDNKKGSVEAYINSLLYELKAVKEVMKGKTLNTVYIGGGTPTSLEVHELERIIKFIKTQFNSNIKEFTVEAGRPDTINLEKLKMFKEYEIDRISINPQTMNNETLITIGRSHDVKSTLEAYNLAKFLNFDIINMDLILGLPGEGIKMVRKTMTAIKDLNPENITVHSLAIKRGSNLHKETDKLNLQKEDEMDYIFNYVNENIVELGLKPYYLYRQKHILGNLENVGYSKDNLESIYNISMMEEKETIIGTGLGAVSKIFSPETKKIERVPNYKNLEHYIENTEEMVSRKIKHLNK